MTLNADELKELRAKAEAAQRRAPGLWGSDIEKGSGEYGDGEDDHTGFMVPYMETEHGKRLFDAHHCDVAEVHVEYDEDGVYAWDEAAREIFNFLSAVQPATALSLITAAELNAELVEGLEAAREAVHPLLSQSEDNIWRRAKIVVDLADALIAKAKGQSNPARINPWPAKGSVKLQSRGFERKKT